MKRIILGFALLLTFGSAMAGECSADVQKALEHNEETHIIPAPEEVLEPIECDTYIQTRGVGQVCIPEDDKTQEKSAPQSEKETGKQTMNTAASLLAAAADNENAKKSDIKPSGSESAKVLPENTSGISPKELYAQALALYSDNSTEAALETFKQIPEYARTTTAWTLMGNILADMGKKDEAIFMYRRAISVDSENYKAHYNLGNMYLEDDIFYTAIDCYKDAIKAKMTFPYAYYNLGIAYVKVGNLKKAKSAFLNALEYKKDVADFHYNLAYVYKLMNKPKLAQTYLDNYNKLMGY